ncbi:MAG: tetratricopeptide repeat protein [Methylacidiphilales bacterium]|nr:tetratricopeptide repeat protein [Candidatus Methylacidiphilales bacterium]MDW8349962.1 tetratricopeptide repeat protein [Verrucomicrobiae bacterium]
MIDERKLEEPLPISWDQLRIVLGVVIAVALVIMVYIFNVGQKAAAEARLQSLYRSTATTEQRHELLSRSEATPTAALLWLQLAREYFEKNEYNKSLEAFESFIGRFPKHSLLPTAEYGRAVSLLYLGRTDEAQGAFVSIGYNQQAAAYAPLALIQAARIAIEKKNFSEARRLLRETQQLYSQSVAAFEAQSLLRDLPPEPNSPTASVSPTPPSPVQSLVPTASSPN